MAPDTRAQGTPHLAAPPGFAGCAAQAHEACRTRLRRAGDGTDPGAAPATLATMKKLLLLVVIVALATIATKKVRAS